MADDRELRGVIEDVVDKGATTVEDIHKRIAEMPLDLLAQLGVFERTAGNVKEIQEASIGAVYELIRDVNHRVAQLAREVLETSRNSATSSSGD